MRLLSLSNRNHNIQNDQYDVENIEDDDNVEVNK